MTVSGCEMNIDLQKRIDKHLPLNPLERILKYLFLNDIAPDQIDYSSKSFRRIAKFKGLTEEESIRFLKKYFSPKETGITTDIFIPEGRSLYIRKFPRYTRDETHYHKDALEINVVLQGSFYQRIGETMIPMRDGDICFVAPGTGHGTRACDDNTIVLTIIVYQYVIRDLLQRVQMEDGPLTQFLIKTIFGSDYSPYLLCRTSGDPDLVATILDLEDIQDEDSVYTDIYMKTGLELFLLRILMRYQEQIVKGEDTSRREADIRNLMDYIAGNYKNLTLRRLAETFHYSPEYLSSLIHLQYGIGFRDIITDLKLTRAAELLKKTNLSMAEIAEAVGYSEKSYFLRRFKQRYGMTPTAYKRHNGETDGAGWEETGNSEGDRGTLYQEGINDS